MSLDLDAAFPRLLPKAIAWAESMSASILIVGRPLTEREHAIARLVGVAGPDKIRLLELETIPEPDDSELRRYAYSLSLLGPSQLSLTLGHGVCLRIGHMTPPILAHAFRHVYQYEQAGGIGDFLAEYLRQLIAVGYGRAPLEVDARRYETI